MRFVFGIINTRLYFTFNMYYSSAIHKALCLERFKVPYTISIVVNPKQIINSAYLVIRETQFTNFIEEILGSLCLPGISRPYTAALYYFYEEFCKLCQVTVYINNVSPTSHAVTVCFVKRLLLSEWAASNMEQYFFYRKAIS